MTIKFAKVSYLVKFLLRVLFTSYLLGLPCEFKHVRVTGGGALQGAISSSPLTLFYLESFLRVPASFDQLK